MTNDITDMQSFTSAITTLAIEFDLSVTSWIRSASRNADVGGVTNSLHLCGLVVDIVLDDRSQISVFIKRAERFGLRVLNEGTHLHVQVN